MKTMQTASAVLFFSAVLAGCSPSDSALLDVAQRAVSAELKDPGSAQFSNGYIVDFPDPSTEYTKLKYACGEVNAKNSFGAYTGAVRYAVFLGIPNSGAKHEALAVDIEKTPRDQIFTVSFWSSNCKKPS